MSAPNAELAWRVLDHIAANPKLWNQGDWISAGECGTAGCFAGWACMLSGEQPDGWLAMVGRTDHLASDRLIPAQAQRLLGASRYLTDANDDTDDERDLFAPENTFEDLVDYVGVIFGPRPDDTAAWHACAHRADFASAAEHDLNCPAHGADAQAGGAQ